MRILVHGGAVLAGTLARFLFPPVCAGCGGAVSSADAVCPQCWLALTFIERPYCEALGLPFAYDLGKGFLSAEAIAEPPPFERLRAAVLYGDLARHLVASLKYRDRTDLVPLMAGWMDRAGTELLAEADCIVPVPLHRRRLWRRRFNQSAELARRLAALDAARGGRLVHAPRALVRVKATQSQVGLTRGQRETNLKGAFHVPPARRGEIEGRRVLLVDDVYTTGATAGAATRALKRAGARAVDVLVFARVAAGGADGHIVEETNTGSRRWLT